MRKLAIRMGVATDYGGFILKRELIELLHPEKEVVDTKDQMRKM